MGCGDTEARLVPGRQFPEKCWGRLNLGHLTGLSAIGVWSGFKGRAVHCRVKWLIPKAILLFVFQLCGEAWFSPHKYSVACYKVFSSPRVSPVLRWFSICYS